MSTSSFLEIEAKFSVADSTPTPELTRIPSVESVGEPDSQELSAVYYDTEDLRLTRAKITLRRRTGGPDDGWHLKMPGSLGRTEIRTALGSPAEGEFEVPPALLRQVRSIIRNQAVEPIAQVDNSRTETKLFDDSGTPIAEFCDDRVNAWSLLPGGKKTTWREWEVELSDTLAGCSQGSELIRTATTILIGAGARVSSSPSKLTSALGTSLNNAPLPPSQQKAPLDKGSAAAAVVTTLRQDRDKLVEFDPQVRANKWDSVHQMRVATRELRSHLQTFDGIIDGPEIAYFEEELKSLAEILGKARDAEVIDQRWQELATSETLACLDESTLEHLRGDTAKDYQLAHQHVVEYLDSDRYLNLLESFDLFLANPQPAKTTAKESSIAEDGQAEASSESPSTENFARPSTEAVITKRLQQSFQKLLKRHHKAIENWENSELGLHEREEYFHAMRKSAKKLRYAAEAAGATTKLKTKRVNKACKEMQSLLGDFHDAVVSRDKILELARAARQRGEDNFGYGVLYQREHITSREALANYQDAFEKVHKAFKPVAKKLK